LAELGHVSERHCDLGGVWALAQQIGSLMAGGYVAGCMRSRWHEAGDEREFRDGLHGGLVRLRY
jgi:hypothetical protein